MTKQDRYNTYNLTVKGVRVTIVTV